MTGGVCEGKEGMCTCMCKERRVCVGGREGEGEIYKAEIGD